MSDQKVRFSEILRYDMGWDNERIGKYMREMNLNADQFDCDPALIDGYINSIEKFQLEQAIQYILNGKILTVNDTEQKHIYVPSIVIPGCHSGTTGPTGPAGTPGPTGQPGTSNTTSTGSVGTVTGGTATTTTTSGSSYCFNLMGQGVSIGSVTIEGDGEEMIPSFEGDVEGIVEIEDDE